MDVKTFIEIKKADNPAVPVVYEVESRNPEFIEDDGKTIGFRYFDLVNGESTNYSPWIYFGKIVTLDYIKENYPKCEVAINYLTNKGISKLCITTPGFFMTMNDGDVTYEENSQNKPKTR